MNSCAGSDVGDHEGHASGPRVCAARGSDQPYNWTTSFRSLDDQLFAMSHTILRAADDAALAVGDALEDAAEARGDAELWRQHTRRANSRRREDREEMRAIRIQVGDRAVV